MGKCGICGKNAGLMGARLHKAKSWLCSDCLKKAGGFSNAPLSGTLDEIRAIIKKNEEIKTKEINLRKQEGAKYCLSGARGREIIVYENKVVLKVKATLGSFLTGNISDGEKTIYYKDCIGVQFKESGILLGYLQFETAGRIMNNSASNFFNENTFTFEHPNPSNELMKEVANFVKHKVELSKTETNDNNTVSVANEIIKFKNLLDQGIITQEEFDAKKKQLLGL